MSNKKGEGGGGGGREFEKKTSRHIVLGREKKDQSGEAHGNASFWTLNNGEIISSAHMRLHVKITGHRAKLKQELSINWNLFPVINKLWYICVQDQKSAVPFHWETRQQI